jgi:hypothetical protein
MPVSPKCCALADTAAAIRVRGSLLLMDKLRKVRARGASFKPACLIVEPLQYSKLFLAAEPGLRNSGLQHPDRLIVNRERDWKGMPVLAAMSEGKPRRVSEPVGAPWTTSATIASDRTVRAPIPGVSNSSAKSLGPASAAAAKVACSRLILTSPDRTS